MITVKDLILSEVNSSPDGKHWEPALPLPPYSLFACIRDAYAVLIGDAVAIRQTTSKDLSNKP